MKLLLDTHVWLWSLLEPERMGAGVRKALQGPENEVWLSPISIWEALMLIERGRLTLDTDPLEWIEAMVRALPRREAPLTHEVAVESRRIKLPHQDPADRFLAATAAVYQLTLVTADERLLHSKGFAVMANR